MPGGLGVVLFLFLSTCHKLVSSGEKEPEVLSPQTGLQASLWRHFLGL